MGDRGNIAVIQDNEAKEQVWFYGHWSGWRMPAVLQHAIQEGKGRWTDPSYFARIVFCRLVAPDDHYYGSTSFGISTQIGDNEYPIMVADCAKQRVFQIKEDKLKDFRVPADFKPEQSWTFEEYSKLDKLPWGDLQSHLEEIGKSTKEAA